MAADEADQPSSKQRSFRLSAGTLELLDAAAADSGETPTAFAERLISEGVRLERHPLIRFRREAAGRRQPLIVGTRLCVHQVIATARAHDGDVDAAARYLGIAPQLVRAAVDYYGDFPGEVEADAAVAERMEHDERARWERRLRALGVLALDHH